MMNSSEAIKGLDGFSEVLVSLSALLSSNMFGEKSPEHESLLTDIRQKQTDARWFAREILKEINDVGTKADKSADVTGISAVMQRYVLADKQASEALTKGDKANAPTPVADAVDRFRRAAGILPK